MTDGRAAYARSGVDVTAGERAVELMRASVASTRRPEVLGGLLAEECGELLRHFFHARRGGWSDRPPGS